MKKPTKSGNYTVICEGGITILNLHYSKKLDAWNVSNDMKTEMKVEAWCEIEDAKKFIKEKCNEV